MIRRLFILICLFICTLSSPLPLQSISVRGHLYCGQFPMKDVKVKLIDIDPDETDDLLDSAYTDENGYFALSGATREEGIMQGAIKIYHHCGDRLALYGEPSYGQKNESNSRKKKKKICARKIKWNIPNEYNTDGTGSQRWFEIGTINMELGFNGYERDFSTMIRHLGSSSRALSVPARLSRRNFTHFPVAFYRPIDRHFDLMEREMDRAFRHPFWTSPFTSISSLDLSQLPPLIVTENGTKKFKLEFDVSKFKPEEVRVKTTANENTLQVEAKHEDDTCKFEFSRTITVPIGTTLTELKCRFSSDGTLTLEAPFVPPVEEKKEAIQDTDIPVQHT